MPRRLPSHPRQAVAGFTLPELIGALAVTGIVAAVAVSAYRTYLVRSQIAYSVELSSPIRGRVAAAFRSTGLPLSSVEQPGAGTDSAGGLWQYVESVEVINGRLDLRFGYRADHAISGRTLSLTPFETATHEVVWVCGNARPGAGLEPLGFSLGGQQAVQADTLIEPRYLPSTCR